MNPVTMLLIIASLAAVPLSWLVPRHRAADAVAAWAALCLAVLSPVTALWLLASVLLVWAVLRWGRGSASLALVLSAALVLAWLYARDKAALPLIGAAYFTLRNVHLLMEAWMGRLGATSLRQLLHYQFFLPVIVSGPIHRQAHFQREWSRRRWSPEECASGAERALFGAVLALFVGGMLVDAVVSRTVGNYPVSESFLQAWLRSVFDWVRLYCVFSGYSSIALGIALMMGIRLEENFNQPWRATSLMDFWTRWHMTLSSWARDYVFQPLVAGCRSPLLALAAAMVAIGIWHETSVYYLLWAAWQAAGIAGNRLLERWRPLPVLLAPFVILAWLSLAKPVITRLLECFA